MNIKISTEQTNDVDLNDFKRKRVCDSKRIIDVTAIRNTCSPSMKISRIDNEKYLYKPTGEVRFYNKNKPRKDDKSNLMKTFVKIKRIINYNFDDSGNGIHIVLTYEDLMLEPDNLADDFKRFWNKMKYKYKTLEYLRIAEPCASGRWHLHVLVKDVKKPYLFIPFEFIKSCWEHGNIKVTRIKNVDRLSTYFFPSFKETASAKAREKARRLKFYPKGLNIYSRSKGIHIPKFVDMTTSEVYYLVKDCELTYSSVSNITMIDDFGEEITLNKIAKQQFKRNKNQKDSTSTPEFSKSGKEGC